MLLIQSVTMEGLYDVMLCQQYSSNNFVLCYDCRPGAGFNQRLIHFLSVFSRIKSGQTTDSSLPLFQLQPSQPDFIHILSVLFQTATPRITFGQGTLGDWRKERATSNHTAWQSSRGHRHLNDGGKYEFNGDFITLKEQ